MSRIRTIKPEAFTSESLSAVSIGARWTFAGLWTYVDDAGRGRADVRIIKGQLYPVDDATTIELVASFLRELHDAGHVHIFTDGEGVAWLHIPKFNQHQVINRPSKPRSPDCPCMVSVNTHGALMDGKGKGSGSGKGGESAAAASRPPRRCPKHLDDPDPPPCGACADARKLADSWKPATISVITTRCGLHPRRKALNCPECAAAVVGPPPNWRGKKRSA